MFLIPNNLEQLGLRLGFRNIQEKLENGLLYLTPCAKDIQILPFFLSRQIANGNLGNFLQYY